MALLPHPPDVGHVRLQDLLQEDDCRCLAAVAVDADSLDLIMAADDRQGQQHEGADFHESCAHKSSCC